MAADRLRGGIGFYVRGVRMDPAWCENRYKPGSSWCRFEEEIIPITETPEQAAPPPPEAPKVAELLEIVDDKADIEESTTILNEDNTPKVEVKYVPVQVVEEEPEEQTIFEVVENMPDFPGGQAALMQYLAKNIKYPTIAQEMVLKVVLSYSSLWTETVVS